MIVPVVLLAVIGGLLGLGLAIATKVFYVEVDERINIVTEMLPGYNCGACGAPGCSGMAEMLVSNEINLKACKPAKDDALIEIQKYLEETTGPDGKNVKVNM